MKAATVVRLVETEDLDKVLYKRIGQFLCTNRLGPDPLHYAFAHRVLSDPNSPLARAVDNITDGGVRLTRRDIEQLGGEVSLQGAGAIAAARADGEGLVAQTQMQVEGFTDMMHAMRAETQGFGRDLAASAAAIRHANDAVGAAEVTRITAAMLERVRAAESRLEAATHEASELRAKLEEARDNARRDPLTDLPNRRAFEEAYAEAQQGGAPMCLAICDVDHFKAVNDRFGHAVGDRVLKAIAEALSTACEGHVVARYGGEEFALLFTGIDCAASLQTLEVARTTVAGKRYRLRESDEPLGAVTFSGGVTIAAPGESLGTVFGRADALLYAAKDGGRNQLIAG